MAKSQDKKRHQKRTLKTAKEKESATKIVQKRLKSFLAKKQNTL
jgi:hypothetical protein